jgi:hypothetical protein
MKFPHDVCGNQSYYDFFAVAVRFFDDSRFVLPPSAVAFRGRFVERETGFGSVTSSSPIFSK